jgi:hypothetical protein
MRSFFINKNLSFYYWLKKRTGKTIAFRVANTTEKILLIFGRERMPHARAGLSSKALQLGLILWMKKTIFILKLMNSTRLTR